MNSNSSFSAVPTSIDPVPHHYPPPPYYYNYHIQPQTNTLTHHPPSNTLTYQPPSNLTFQHHPINLNYPPNSTTFQSNHHAHHSSNRGLVAANWHTASFASLNLDHRSTHAPHLIPTTSTPQQHLLKRNDFVQVLVATAAEIIEALYPTPATVIIPLKTFISEILRRSKSSFSTLQLSLFYLFKFRAILHNQNDSTAPEDDSLSRCGRRLFLAALVLAAKFLQDKNYSSKAWSKISGLSALEINANERHFLHVVEYQLFVSASKFARWSALLVSHINSVHHARLVASPTTALNIHQTILSFDFVSTGEHSSLSSSTITAPTDLQISTFEPPLMVQAAVPTTNHNAAVPRTPAPFNQSTQSALVHPPTPAVIIYPSQLQTSSSNPGPLTNQRGSFSSQNSHTGRISLAGSISPPVSTATDLLVSDVYYSSRLKRNGSDPPPPDHKSSNNLHPKKRLRAAVKDKYK